MKTNKIIRYTYEDAQTIQRFADSNAFFRGIMGPFGSGKSSGCTIDVVRKAHLVMPMEDGIRRSRFSVIRNTSKQLKDTTIKTVMDWFPETHFGTYNKSEMNYKITAFEGLEIEIIFRALDRPDQVSDLLSLELTGSWLNEAREIPWEIVKPLMGRVGRYPSKKEVAPGGWFGIFADTNPPDTDSWWYEFFETEEFQKLAGAWEAKHPGRVFREGFKQPSGLSDQAENTRFLEDGYYDLLAADPDQDWVKVHVHGQYGFIKDGKPVYPDYHDNLHCRRVDPVEGLPIYRGWDFGLTPAVVFAQVVNGQLRFIDELCATRAGIDVFSNEAIPYCVENYPKFKFIDYGDPAGKQGSQQVTDSCFDILRRKGVEIEGDDWTQDPETRTGTMMLAMNRLVDGEPGMVVDPRCKLLRKGFQGGYKYKRKAVSGEARYNDAPDKNKYSHPHDAAQYITANLFGELLRDGKAARDEKMTPQTVANEDFDLFFDEPGDYAHDDYDYL